MEVFHQRYGIWRFQWFDQFRTFELSHLISHQFGAKQPEFSSPRLVETEWENGNEEQENLLRAKAVLFFPISTRTYEKHFNTVDPGIDQKVKEYI